MQKKIIALAVAGLMSGAAFAQSNVTISGLMGYTLGRGIQAAPIAGVNSADTGYGTTDGHINFAAREDLGKGWAAGTSMELRLRGRGTANADGVGGRNAIVFLTTPYGTFDGGSIELGNGIWGRGSAGAPIQQIDKIWEGTTKMGISSNTAAAPAANGFAATTAAQTWILSTQANADLMRYTSPVFMGGFKAWALRADSIGAPAAGDGAAGNAAGLDYANGPIDFGIDFTNFTNFRRADGQNRTRISGNYNFGVVKVGAGWEKNSRFKGQSLFGISAPIGAMWSVGATYAKNHELDNKAWALGVNYAFSKRTSLNFTTSNATVKKYANTAVAIDAGGANTVDHVGLVNDQKQSALRLMHTF
jgi:predicted porin